ncbi:hypothetical protein M408DRAFT_9559 [Serendipita vermifera MAFF 305830]|uniref:RTA1 like protein n=1 Tax=Serendipita vermifera MAFF 305830 TaxID=933852 RepID=A0A0C2WKS3_SERVB|nr:hypothetical protein M408DRAFT_9559 [Serendipita vermifera MAFF 305830]
MTNFPYSANKPAAVIFATLFGLAMTIHIFQAARARAYFLALLVLAAEMEVLGYGFRFVSIAVDPQHWPVAMSQVTLMVSPAILSAQACIVAGRMMSYIDPNSSLMPHNIVIKIFIFFHVAFLLVQGTGTSLLTSSDEPSESRINLGRAILAGGLSTQILASLVFIAIIIKFESKGRRLAAGKVKDLRQLFVAFYVSETFIIGRSIYRTIEFATFNPANQGYLYYHEWPLYVFDAAPILIALTLFNFVHPVAHLPRDTGHSVTGESRHHWWSKGQKYTAQSTLVSQDMPMERV